MTSIDDILGQLKLPERVYPLCTNADLRAEWEQADAVVTAEYRDSMDSLAGTSKAGKDAAKRAQELETEMAEHTVHLRLRALAHKAWSDLVAANPPREGSDDGQWNSETFGVALLAASAVDPVMSEEQAAALVDRLTLGQWNELQVMLFNLSTGSVEVPKSRRASEVLRNSRKR